MIEFFSILMFLTTIIPSNAQKDSLVIEFDSIVSDQSKIYEIIDPFETMPEFSGGYDSLKIFIDRHNKWHVGRETIVGKVFVGFIVEPDGSITNIEIVKGLHKSCDKEALRIVSLMPKWKPGKQSGKPIRTKMIFPIFFDGLK